MRCHSDRAGAGGHQAAVELSGEEQAACSTPPAGSRTDLGAGGSSGSNRAIGVLVPALTQSAAIGALPVLRAVTAPDVVGGEL